MTVRIVLWGILAFVLLSVCRADEDSDLFDEAKRLLRANDPIAARALLDQVDGPLAKTNDYHLFRASILASLEENDTALEELHKVTSEDPKVSTYIASLVKEIELRRSFQHDLQSASSALSNKKYSEALRLYSRCFDVRQQRSDIGLTAVAVAVLARQKDTALNLLSRVKAITADEAQDELSSLEKQIRDLPDSPQASREESEKKSQKAPPAPSKPAGKGSSLADEFHKRLK